MRERVKENADKEWKLEKTAKTKRKCDNDMQYREKKMKLESKKTGLAEF